jgi:hypothetical protein
MSLLTIISLIRQKFKKQSNNINNEGDKKKSELEQMLETKEGINLLSEYAQKEFSTENLVAHEKLKFLLKKLNSENWLSDESLLIKLSKQLIDEHLLVSAVMDINLPGKVRENAIHSLEFLIKILKENTNVELTDKKKKKQNETSTLSTDENEDLIKNLNNIDSNTNLKEINEQIMNDKENIIKVLLNVEDNLLINLNDTFSRLILTSEYEGYISELSFKKNYVEKYV